MGWLAQRVTRLETTGQTRRSTLCRKLSTPDSDELRRECVHNADIRKRRFEQLGSYTQTPHAHCFNVQAKNRSDVQFRCRSLVAGLSTSESLSVRLGYSSAGVNTFFKKRIPTI